MMRVSAALQKQESRDLEPIWEITATVDAFASLEEGPDGYWPMIIKDKIGTPGAAVVHMHKHGHPFPLSPSSTPRGGGPRPGSHEMCELLVDPSGYKQAT